MKEKIADQFNDNELIQKELSKYSWKFKREFEKLFPCKNPLHIIDVANKEYIDEQNMIGVKMKLAKLQDKEYKPIIEQYSMETISFESSDEFWSRWNRFKKLKILI